MKKILALVAMISLCVSTLVQAEPIVTDSTSRSTTYSYSQEMKCVRWSWTGDVYERKVVCLEWKKETKK